MGNLAGWYAQLKKLATKKKKKERELRQLNLEMGSLNRKIGGIQGKIEKLNGKPIELSPHAVMRFQERIQYMDLVDIGNLVLTENLYQMVDTLGDGKYPLEIKSINKNITVVVEDRVVKTLWKS